MLIILRAIPLSLLIFLLLVVACFGQSALPLPLLEIFHIKLDDPVSIRKHYGALGFSPDKSTVLGALEIEHRCKMFWGALVGFNAQNISALGVFTHPGHPGTKLLVCKFKKGVPLYLARTLCKSRGAWLLKNIRPSSMVMCARNIQPPKGENGPLQTRPKKA